MSTADGDRLSVPPDAVWTVGRESDLFVAAPDNYVVERRPAHGRRQRYARAASPVEYLAAERQEWEAMREANARRNAHELAAIPKQKPFIRELFVDAQRRLWVGRYALAEQRVLARPASTPSRPRLTYRERNHYDLFEVDNSAYVGTVVLPPNARVIAFERDKVWLVEEGASGAEQLVAYAVSVS